MTFSKQIIIALDQGSSSSRALAIDHRGRIVVRAQFPVGTMHPRPGWVEHDAQELCRSLERALDDVLSRLPSSVNIVGLGLACQRSTVLFWDKKTGKPVSPALSWQDGRAQDLVEKMGRRRDSLHRMTGLYLSPYYSASKMRWFLDNDGSAQVLLKAGRLLVGPVLSYALWKMSMRRIFAIDPTLAQRTMLMNLGSLQWHARLLRIFNIPREILPEIRPSVGNWGVIKRRGRSIPILACLGDQQAAVMGLGGLKVGTTLANYGTGAFLLHNGGRNSQRIPGLLTSVGWTINKEFPFFLQEGPVNEAGAAFDRLAESGIIKKAADLGKLCRLNSDAKTVLGGTNAADTTRAVAESIAFQILDIADAMRSGGLKLKRAHVSGGLSRLDYLMQFQADILGIKMLRLAEADATALGAAALAAQACGDAAWSKRIVRIKVERVFSPRMPRAEAKNLVSQWKRFVAVNGRK